jgi:hypothetical protein
MPDRLARCGEDAADEGNLDLRAIRAVGVAFPGDMENISARRARSAVLSSESIR